MSEANVPFLTRDMTASKELYAVCDHFLSVESRHAAMSETKRDPKKKVGFDETSLWVYASPSLKLAASQT